MTLMKKDVEHLRKHRGKYILFCMSIEFSHRRQSFVTGSLMTSGSSREGPVCQFTRCKRFGFDPRVGKIPQRRAWPPTPVFLPGEYHGHRNLAGYSSQVHKESDTTEATQHTQIHLPLHTFYITVLNLVSGTEKQQHFLSRHCRAEVSQCYLT